MEPKSPDGAEASFRRLESSCSKMQKQSKEEFQERRKKHAKKLSNKIGKTFKQLENSLPEQFMPKEKTREAILEQTKKYAQMMESQLVAAPCTALCLICNKPRIACGCEVPDYLRQPLEQVDRRMEAFIKRQMRKAREVGSDDVLSE